jgi:hypothetical protein
MNIQNAVISIQEARTILGADARDMTDTEIEYLIEALDIMAKDALKLAKDELHRKRDAKQMAELIYDVYKDKKDIN